MSPSSVRRAPGVHLRCVVVRDVKALPLRISLSGPDPARFPPTASPSGLTVQWNDFAPAALDQTVDVMVHAPRDADFSFVLDRL